MSRTDTGSATAGSGVDPAAADPDGPVPSGDSDWEPFIRIGGLVVAIAAALVTGVLEVLLSTLRAGDLGTMWRGAPIGSGGGPLLGLSILLAAVGNYAIGWFAVGTTGRRWALGPPWALWTILMLFAAGVRTREGDSLLSGDNWVALVMILVGSLTYAVYSYRMILKAPRP